MKVLSKWINLSRDTTGLHLQSQKLKEKIDRDICHKVYLTRTSVGRVAFIFVAFFDKIFFYVLRALK